MPKVHTTPHPLVDGSILQQAWKRVRLDLADRVFCRHPYEQRLVELDTDRWLDAIAGLVESNTYSPRPMYVVDVPKPNGGVRTAPILTLADHVVYTACVASALGAIRERIAWSQNTVDFAYRLSADPNEADWFYNQFKGWKAFRDRSTELLDAGFTHVIFTDLVSFYDTVDLSILISDLKGIGLDERVLAVLSTCLNPRAFSCR